MADDGHRRGVWILAVVAASLALGAATWWWMSRTTDSDSGQVTALPPVTAPVELVQVARTVPVQAEVVAEAMSVSWVSMAITGEAVVTRVSFADKDGPAELVEGQPVIEVSGRPIILLNGSVPAFRTMARGTVGDDVKQLQEALVRLGYDPGTTDGTYGRQTASAVWYADMGYIAVGGEGPFVPLAVTARTRASVPFGEVMFVPWEAPVLDSVSTTVGAPATGPLFIVRDPEVSLLIGPLSDEVVPARAYAVFDVGGRSLEAVDPTPLWVVDVEGERQQRVQLRPLGDLAARVGDVIGGVLVLDETDDLVLAVPPTAIFEEDGEFYVEVVGVGELERVPVEVGVVGDRWVEVEPITPGALSAEDEVIVFSAAPG
ncbi:MAG: peptidoglycan-binding protein [Actinobacteria bacterium]|nr:peptidoglycan-binding protein [Actinomycetota bacterium]